MYRRKLLPFLFFAILIILPSSVVLAQEKTLVWNRYDANITVQKNGDIFVEETQEITFTSGSFHFGYRAIPLDRVEDITNLQVFERQGDRLMPFAESSSENENTFRSFVNDSNELVIYWYFPYTSGTTHTYVLRYVVKGGLRIYDEGDQVWWKAIPPDRGFPITSSQVKVTLPATFNPDQLKYESYGAVSSVYNPNGSTVIFTASDIFAGDEMEVQVQFPHGMVSADVPAWQSADDHQRELQEKLGPILNIGLLFLSLLILFGGPLAIYALWYTKGRDLPAGIVAEYITEPPSDIPPGAAGTLIDEQADMEDILATLIDLARRGAIQIEEVNEKGFLGIGSGRKFTYYLNDETLAKTPYEKRLIDKIFGSKKICELEDLQQTFYRYIPKLKDQLYDHVVELGYFPANPRTIRARYMGLGVAAIILGVMAGVLLIIATVDYSDFAICPGMSILLTAIIMLVVGRHMPRKTKLGAEEAAKWKAFKRYLSNIDRYGSLEEAKEQFDKYLPYAIAFGIDKSYMRQFERVENMTTPAWYGLPPVWAGGGHNYGGNIGDAQTSNMPTLAGGQGKPPTLSNMSKDFGTSLSSMSAGLGSMLSTASRTMTSTPPSSSSGGSSGGWSGGGGSFGGGGGGGSAGFG